ncbi:SDR family oxidoreductase [Roseomonas eburnea]|uniref:SDR family oxidoreductase n=1 Tax=Neoroseomonas eburnea TaxID=1346889 RepID=A0A9X9X955_9PROT|nr:SDR family oxidoreductase [Neoroseomonas eburnea]MBR0680241.1 SDR family oxidoreductase [Neoroseomonas eburnea]
MDLGLKGKRALVMGGAKGLGRSIADAIAAEGAVLTISGRDTAAMATAAEELKAVGAQAVTTVVADVGNGEDMDRLAEAAVKAMGGVDILVLNHGGPPVCTASEMKEADLVKWFQNIVVSPIRITMKLMPAMRAQKWGRVIVVGSSGMHHPIPTLALSNTLRASIWAWLKTLSGEVAADGVTMNVLAPGTILTDRVRGTSTVRAEKEGITFDEALSKAAKEIPMGRLGKPEDYGPMGAFLAGETGGYITGTMIRVDGGRVRSML